MKRSLTLIFLGVYGLCLGGCQGGSGASPQIQAEFETLQEGDFEFKYPKDWKISSRGDKTNPQEQYLIYYFMHPRNRDIAVTIEITHFPERRYDSDLQSRRVLSEKVRALRKQFQDAKYSDFDFETASTRFAGYDATKLTVTGNKDGQERRAYAILLPSAKDFYVISYPWFDFWTDYTKRKIAEIVNSFLLTY